MPTTTRLSRRCLTRLDKKCMTPILLNLLPEQHSVLEQIQSSSKICPDERHEARRILAWDLFLHPAKGIGAPRATGTQHPEIVFTSPSASSYRGSTTSLDSRCARGSEGRAENRAPSLHSN